MLLVRGVYHYLLRRAVIGGVTTRGKGTIPRAPNNYEAAEWELCIVTMILFRDPSYMKTGYKSG